MASDLLKYLSPLGWEHINAELAKKKARMKIPQIAASIAGHRLTDPQRFVIRHALRHLEAEVEALKQEILRRMEDPTLAEAFQLLQSIPGIKEESAASILAERSSYLAWSTGQLLRL